MVVPLIVLISAQAKTPPVKLEEAVAVAKRFSQIGGFKTKGDDFSVRYRRSGAKSDIWCYDVTFREKWDRSMSVEVDATSGDVIFAKVSPHPRDMVDAGAPQAAAWLKKLGKIENLVYDKYAKTYVVAFNGKPFFNRSGSTEATLRVQDGMLAWYQGVGALPPKPKAKPSVTEKKAIERASLLKPLRQSPARAFASVRAEQGLFYDETTESTHWVWRVLWLRKGGSVAGTAYVNAETGYLLADDIGSSRFLYRSRAPRSGLAMVKTLTVEPPLLAKVKQMLKDLGRGDLEVKSITTKDGLKVDGVGGVRLQIGSDGKLRLFEAMREIVRGKAPSNTFQLGRTIIARFHPKLPEGTLQLGSIGRNGAPGKVFYRQRALTYDYLFSELVSVEFDARGKVTRYESKTPAPKPAGVPKSLRTAKEIEELARRIAKPHVPKDTGDTSYYASAQSQGLGWYVDATGKPKLSYSVRVMFNRRHRSGRVQGQGSVYPFDAVTGNCLRPFP